MRVRREGRKNDEGQRGENTYVVVVLPLRVLVVPLLERREEGERE